ncbi:unnamed protein product, partial [Polarella glacialis]
DALPGAISRGGSAAVPPGGGVVPALTPGVPFPPSLSMPVSQASSPNSLRTQFRGVAQPSSPIFMRRTLPVAMPGHPLMASPCMASRHRSPSPPAGAVHMAWPQQQGPPQQFLASPVRLLAAPRAVSPHMQVRSQAPPMRDAPAPWAANVVVPCWAALKEPVAAMSPTPGFRSMTLLHQ